jgi:hypothetical protein
VPDSISEALSKAWDFAKGLAATTDTGLDPQEKCAKGIAMISKAMSDGGYGQMPLEQMNQLRAQCGLPDYASIDDAAADLKLGEDDTNNLGIGLIDAGAGAVENRQDVRYEHPPDDKLDVSPEAEPADPPAAAPDAPPADPDSPPTAVAADDGGGGGSGGDDGN